MPPLAKGLLSRHFAPMMKRDNKTNSPLDKDTPLKGKDKAKSDAAQERVAEALRANLRRRKAQTRDRSE